MRNESSKTCNEISKSARITSFNVGRVFNLGNYENVRYDLTVEVPAGRSVCTALKNVLRLFGAIRPKPPVDKYTYENSKSQLSDPQAWHKNVEPAKARRKVIREMVKHAKANVKAYETWQARRLAAWQMLDSIGCCKVFKDAKLDWDDDPYDC